MLRMLNYRSHFLATQFGHTSQLILYKDYRAYFFTTQFGHKLENIMHQRLSKIGCWLEHKCDNKSASEYYGKNTTVRKQRQRTKTTIFSGQRALMLMDP